jgi:aminoglycoside 3-N-acetyltransferase
VVPEKNLVDRSTAPQTVASLAEDLDRLGLPAGETVLVHSSLSSLGWVCGGAVALVEALLSVLGPGGTLVVPTHSDDLSDPAQWANPPVPESWWDTIRATMPAYRPASTPTRGMGAVPEVVRTWPDARRSDHPQVSFAAVGPASLRITGGHSLADGLGEGSPLARLYELDASILLLGVGHDRNTSLHLAEYRSGVRARVQQSGPVLVEGERAWVSWTDIDLDVDDLAPLGADLDRAGLVHVGSVGNASARQMKQRRVVDYATEWFRRRQPPR